MNPKNRISLFVGLVFLIGAGTACNLPGNSGGTDAVPTSSETTLAPQTPQSPESATATPTALPALDVPRILIRSVDGMAEFFDSETGDRFTPRGFNYIHFLPTEREFLEDRVMAENHYDPVEVRAAFRQMAGVGYNTVRIFFDICSFGPYCFARENGEGLNPGYLDNMVDLMRIAGEEGIYLIFTANAIPDGGGYWQIFDNIFYSDDHPGFVDGRNADWLHTAGVETKRQMWQDLMDGLVEREAPFAAVLGWELTNEFWLWGDVPPLSLTEGMVTTANGVSYDMASAEQKRQMVVDGTIYFMEQIVPVIKAADPQALTTMGFFAPYFGGSDRYFVTDALLQTPTPVDFWDFHAYFDTELSITEQAESFGMLGYTEKPVIMGETGAGHAYVPSAASALTKGVEWYAQSCEAGFGGWLYWGYYPWPEEVGGAAWAGLEEDGLLFTYLSPDQLPDVCSPPESLPVSNAAYKQPVRVSRYNPGEPPDYAVDGSAQAWTAGDYPPQWIEIDLGGPTTVSRVAMNVAQWPAGITQHQVTARMEDGSTVVLGTIKGFTMSEQLLAIELPNPLPGVVAVRLTTTQSPAWPGWTEVEVVSGEEAAPACVGRVDSGTELLADPFSDADALGRFSAGALVYLDGFYTDPGGAAWGRSGGDSWVVLDVLDVNGDCDQTALAAEPGTPLVPVTFRVRVPEGTPGEVFMGGMFPEMGWNNWVPWMIVLQNKGGNVHEVTLLLPEGIEIAYLFTRQNWETVERSAACTSIADRTLLVSGAAEVEHTVEAWRDLDCGGE